PFARVRRIRHQRLQPAEQPVATTSLFTRVPDRSWTGGDECVVRQLIVPFEVSTKGPTDIRHRHIVDRRLGHARLDSLEVGEIVEAGLENSMGGGGAIEPSRWSEDRT